MYTQTVYYTHDFGLNEVVVLVVTGNWTNISAKHSRFTECTQKVYCLTVDQDEVL